MDFISGESLVGLVKAIGYLGLFGIVFAESGLFFGFFFPGDSLLFAAGLLASQNYLNIAYVLLGIFISAVLGDNIGYTFGKRVGPKIFRREDSFFFHKKNLIKAENFYKRYGPITIVLARFIPVVRTFAPIVAGVGRMSYRTFLFYNVAGGFLWSVGLTLSGYYLTKIIPGVERYISYVIALIIVLSIIPLIIAWIIKKNK